jgi:hypothetical protein
VADLWQQKAQKKISHFYAISDFIGVGKHNNGFFGLFWDTDRQLTATSLT